MIPLLIGCCSLYLGRVLFFLAGFVRRRSNVLSSWTGGVTVVVPARNEEANIERCVHALFASNWPAALLDVVIVNDRSTDGTAKVLEALSGKYESLRVLHRTEGDVDENLRGKPGALQAGIDVAHHDVVLLTDADCTVAPTWVATMARTIHDQHADMVCASTSVRTTSPAAFLQDVEWTFSNAMARASLNHGVPLGCFGNNMALRASAFNAIGGYRGIQFSVTEDLALLQAMTKAGHSVVYRCDAASSVVTDPCVTLPEYIRQRQRWARGGLALGQRATLFVASSLALWVGLALSAITGMWVWFVALAVLRIVADSTLIVWALCRLQRYQSIVWVIPAVVMLMCTELALPLLVLQKNVTWKGQVFRG